MKIHKILYYLYIHVQSVKTYNSLLTVTFWLLDSADSPRENSISLTSLSPWAITWQHILFKVLTLNVAICIVCLHFCSCCLSSVADFFERWGQGPSLSRTRLFFTRAKSDAVYVFGLSVGHGYFSMAVFILIYRSHFYWWAAVVPRLNWR